jgi:hypothetical protein
VDVDPPVTHIAGGLLLLCASATLTVISREVLELRFQQAARISPFSLRVDLAQGADP